MKQNNDMIQTGLWLPKSLLAGIRKTAGPRGMGAEVRRRLEEWQTLYDAGYRVEKQITVTNVVTHAQQQ